MAITNRKRTSQSAASTTVATEAAAIKADKLLTRYINTTGKAKFNQKRANLKLHELSETDAALITRFDALLEDESEEGVKALAATLESFKNKILFAQYNPGKNLHIDKRYCNTFTKDQEGKLVEFSFFTLFEDNEEDLEIIEELDEALDTADDDSEEAIKLAQAAANEIATRFYRENFRLSYQRGLAKVRTFDF